MKILLAVDGSAFSKKMLAYLSTHEQFFSPSNDYTVFTVQPALPPQVETLRVEWQRQGVTTARLVVLRQGREHHTFFLKK